MIKNQPVAFVTLIGTISGIVITQVTNLFFRCLGYRNSLKLKRFDLVKELEKKNLIKPLVEFIDKNLRLGQKTYALIYQPEDLNHDISFLHEHIFDLSTVEARINIIGNKQLSKKLKQFSSPRIDVGTAVSERMDAGITVPQTREKMLTKSLSLPSI